MGDEGARPDVVTLRDYVQVVRRRKWTVLAVAAIATGASIALSLHEQRRYAASAELLLGTPRLSLSQSKTAPDRVAATQARLAQTPLVAQRVLAAAGVRNRSPRALLAATTVKPTADSDLLTFTVTDADARAAEHLATAYAREFIRYRRALDAGSVAAEREGVEAQLRRLVQAGRRRGPLYHELAAKDRRLQEQQALQTGDAVVVAAADRATQVAPRPRRYGAVGLGLGIVFGLVLAFVREALDQRVRTVAELRRRLRLPLLGRVPAPSRRPLLRSRTGLVMIDAPYGDDAEAYRILRANFDFFNVEHGARTIMVTSALERDGKTTTVANLAVALARAGRRTVLVDLDLRRPALRRRFKLGGGPGVTDVARGRVPLEDALVPVSVTSETNGAATLHVLGSGSIPPDVGEFVASSGLAALLRQLRRDADVVLVDAPPLVRVGDAMALGARVDAVLVVARLDRAPRALVAELRRLLAACPAAKLGFVVAGAELDEDDLYAGSDVGQVPAESPTAVW